MAYTLSIGQDDLAESPRQYGENLGILTLHHSRYNLANEGCYSTMDFEGWTDMREGIVHDGGLHVIPVWAYIHSGITVAASEANPFSCPWDSGLIGFVYTTQDRIDEFGADESRIREFLTAEVAEYDQWLRGDMYLVAIKDEDGNVVEAVGGFFDEDYARSEGEAMLAAWNEESILV